MAAFSQAGVGGPVPEDSRHSANYEVLPTTMGEKKTKTDNKGALRPNSSLQEQRKVYYITKRWGIDRLPSLFNARIIGTGKPRMTFYVALGIQT